MLGIANEVRCTTTVVMAGLLHGFLIVSPKPKQRGGQPLKITCSTSQLPAALNSR
jgi:hypothetical protein